VAQTVDIASLRKRLLSEGRVPRLGELGAPDAAVAIIIDPNYVDGSVLLIRRVERENDPWSGQIAFPGGHKAPNDRAFSETAVREAEEEVGINLRKHEFLGSLPPVHARTRRTLVAPFVFQLKGPAKVRVNEEVAESFWAPLEDLATTKMSKAEVYTQNGKLTVSCYIYHSHVIWGLTFRIINSLLGRETAD